MDLCGVTANVNIVFLLYLIYSALVALSSPLSIFKFPEAFGK